MLLHELIGILGMDADDARARIGRQPAVIGEAVSGQEAADLRWRLAFFGPVEVA